MSDIFCIGGAAISVNGYPKTVARLHNSNDGRLEMKVAGVARNVSFHLARYGDMNVHLVSCVGKHDSGTKMILEDAKENGVLTDFMMYGDERCARLICVFDEDFHLLTGINSMEILKKMDPAFFESILPDLNRSALVLMDSNLSSESLTYLITHLTVPTFYEPVSVAKARNIGSNIRLCHTVKANRFEAAQISGCSCDTERGTYRAAEWFLHQGVKQIFITLGSEGVVYASPDSMGLIEGEKVEQVQDSSNAGDALSAGVIHSMIYGLSTEECARNGNHAAALFCQEKQKILHSVKGF